MPAAVLYGTGLLQRSVHRASFRVINLLGSWQIRSEQIDGMAVLSVLRLSLGIKNCAMVCCTAEIRRNVQREGI